MASAVRFPARTSLSGDVRTGECWWPGDLTTSFFFFFFSLQELLFLRVQAEDPVAVQFSAVLQTEVSCVLVSLLKWGLWL